MEEDAPHRAPSKAHKRVEAQTARALERGHAGNHAIRRGSWCAAGRADTAGHPWTSSAQVAMNALRELGSATSEDLAVIHQVV